MTTAYINRIATAVPPHDVHEAFCRFARSLFEGDRRSRLLFERMASRSGIEHRYSCLRPGDGERAVDADDFYLRGKFPDTGARMRQFERTAQALAQAVAVDSLFTID